MTSNVLGPNHFNSVSLPQNSAVMKLLLLSIVLLGIGFAGIAIKIWAKKDGEFDGTCAGSNVKLKTKGIVCGCGNEEGCQSRMNENNAELPAKGVA